MLLGIDIGTSSIKAAIVSLEGRVSAQSQMSIDSARPHPLWSEQNPADWWRATDAAVRALPNDARAAVVAVGLAGQMHGACLLDSSDRVIRPAILWNDGRSFEECTELADIAPLGEVTGNLAMPGFTAPKLMWVRRHEPANFARVAKVMLPKDYVRLLMTGDHATDLSDASGTLWLDVAHRRWSDDMLAACELGVHHMPSLYEGNSFTGRLRGEVAAAWGMERVPVAAGGGDNAAGAVGCGVVDPGDALLSLGTSGVIFVAEGAYRSNPAGGVHSFCHALPDRWHGMSVMLSCAAAVDWAAAALGFDGVSALHAAAADGDPGEALFLPYLVGERTPHNDPLATASFVGLTAATDRDGLARVVLEGVAFGLADGLEALLAAGYDIETLSVIGGGSRSTVWADILAAALGRRLVYRSDAAIGPAYGAARLARMALTGESAGKICTPPPVERVVEPSQALADGYVRKRERFRAAYRPQISEIPRS